MAKRKKSKAEPLVGLDPERERRQEQRTALWNLRERLQLTQSELARALGMGLRSVTRFEAEGDIIPAAAVKKIIELADGGGLEGDVHWWGMYLEKSLRSQAGIDVSLAFMEGREAKTENAEAIKGYIELRQLFQPKLDEGNQRILTLMDQKTSKLLANLVPQKPVLCPKCKKADRTHRIPGNQFYFCERCKQGDRIPTGE